MKTPFFLALTIIGCLVFISSCSKDNQECLPSISTSPNILLIIADDLGKDALSGFTEGSIKPNTPHIDAIRNGGVSLNNCWVYPTCTPTRSSIITGKYGYHTGVKWAGDILPSTEVTLQQYMNNQLNNAYSTAVIGKWHLSGTDATANPEEVGIDHYSGIIRGAANDYYNWQLTEDGATSFQTEYMSTFFANESIEWVNQQTKPWFLWLAFNAPHTPFHAPPVEMHSQGELIPYVEGMDAMPYYMAAIEAMDFQIGRVLDAIPPDELDNTVILFLGDNGSPIQVAQPPYSAQTSKGSLYQGGINVPLFVSGNGIPPMSQSEALVTGTDLFATIARIAGVSVSEINDSKSFYNVAVSGSESPRTFQYSEMDDGIINQWTISNGSYKLFIAEDGAEEFYHLAVDPYETNNLFNETLSPDQLAVQNELLIALSEIRD